MRLVHGECAPMTGVYKVMSREGKTVGSVYVGKGETMPPISDPDGYYEYDE